MLTNLTFLALCLSLSLPALAAERAERRMNNQEDKILNGAFSGDLTRREVKHLQRQQRKIERYEEKASADGLSAEEKARLEKMQDRALTNIYNKKRNNNDKSEVNLRQKRQAERMENGLEKGTLTQEEYDKLKKRQERIQAYEAAALSDGNLSDAEKAKLRRKQNKASKAIHRKKHNAAGSAL